VIAALTGEEALELSDDLDNSIDIVVMDVVMPDVNGPELAERILERHPQARLIFASGYGTGAEAALKRRHKNALYLRKPFGIQQLYNRIEEALGQE
jgi:two-component system cell cycle sensor histidine kinase/response regulator CckA